MSSRVRTFTRELERRRVYRVASLYVVVGLAVLGAAELILDPLGLEEARLVVVVLTLTGFPVSLVLAWLCELRTESRASAGRDDDRAAGSVAPIEATRPDREAGEPGASAAGAASTRRLAAIMFTDMVGYTELVQRDERDAREKRDRTRRILTAEIGPRGGEIVQFYGDGALSIFPSAVSAVEAAIAIQREAARGEPVALRIGIHIGDVVHDREGAFGDGVNVASRIEALSVPGGVLVSGKVHDEIRNRPEIETRFLGEFELKNVRQPIPVHAVCNDGLSVPEEGALPLQAGDAANSVAVLPFANMSADLEDEYFTDGISEELINLLTRVNGLKVTARTSSFSFKGRNVDVRHIGRELGVRHVLEGSVRRSGDRVRITAQLCDTRHGYHLFSETYDRTVQDVLETQDEISRTIVQALAPRLESAGATGRDGGGRAISIEAHNEYLKGLFHWSRWTPDGARAAIRHFEHACEIDPGAALPHSGLAISYAYLGFLGQVPFPESYFRASRAASRALELDGSLGESHVALALVRLFGEWDFEGAYTHFQKALSLNPGAASVHHLYAIYLLSAGDITGAVEEMETAAALDPLSLMILQNLGMAYHAVGRLEDATRVVGRVLAADPHFRAALETRGWILWSRGEARGATEVFEELRRLMGDPLKGVASLGYVYAKQGRREEALQMLELLERRRERDPGVALGLDFAVVHTALGNHDQAVDHLLEARDRHQAAVLMVPSWPTWEELLDHPRLIRMFREMGRPHLPSKGGARTTGSPDA